LIARHGLKPLDAAFFVVAVMLWLDAHHGHCLSVNPGSDILAKPDTDNTGAVIHMNVALNGCPRTTALEVPAECDSLFAFADDLSTSSTNTLATSNAESTGSIRHPTVRVGTHAAYFVVSQQGKSFHLSLLPRNQRGLTVSIVDNSLRFVLKGLASEVYNSQKLDRCGIPTSLRRGFPPCLAASCLAAVGDTLAVPDTIQRAPLGVSYTGEGDRRVTATSSAIL
jgi:hypothetical protein